jgi:hypothetical protein
LLKFHDIGLDLGTQMNLSFRKKPGRQYLIEDVGYCHSPPGMECFPTVCWMKRWVKVVE